jgi:hypothetical protein
MSDRYPFPLPESTIASIEKERSPVWRRYTHNGSGDWDGRLLAWDCFDWWRIAAEGQMAAPEEVLSGLYSKESNHPGLAVFQDSRVFGIFWALRSLMKDFKELNSFMLDTLPHDPELRQLIAEACSNGAKEIRLTKDKRTKTIEPAPPDGEEPAPSKSVATA